MQFSQRRFLAFAGEYERFALASVPAQPEANHPLQARVDARQLHVHIDLHRWGRPLRDEVLHVVLDGNPPLRFRCSRRARTPC